MDSKKLDLVTEYEFEAGADAPMSMAYGDNVRVSIHWPWPRILTSRISMAPYCPSQYHSIVCGVNETPEKIEKGTNAHCRVLTMKDDKEVFTHQLS